MVWSGRGTGRFHRPVDCPLHVEVVEVYRVKDGVADDAILPCSFGMEVCIVAGVFHFLLRCSMRGRGGYIRQQLHGKEPVRLG